MKRRQFLASIGTAGALAATGLARPLAAAADTAAPRPSAAAGPLPAPLSGTPAVFAPTPTSLTITLPLRSAAFARIEYGETTTLDRHAWSDPWGFVPHDARVIKIRLLGLKPGTRYHWRAVLKPLDGEKESRTPVYSSKTLDPAAAGTRFTVWSDTHDKPPAIQKLHSLRSPDDDFLIWTGDLSNNVNDPALLPGIYVSPKDVNLAEGPPILLARGNHDVRGLWSNKMTDYVDFPTERPFYAFRSGPLAAIVLDTGEDKPDSHPSFKGVAAFAPLIEEQAGWLGKIIRHPIMRSAPYRLVFCHMPLRGTNETPPDYNNKEYDRVCLRGRAVWHESLVSWGAQVIISGHIHRHVWLPANEKFPYAQLTAGGHNPAGATFIRGHAAPKELRLTTTRTFEDTLVHETTLPPLA